VLAPLAASGHRLATRALTVYRVYAERPAVFAPVIAALPTTPTVIGLASQGDVPHAALWKPYGRHEFVYVDLADAPARLRARGVRWLVVGTDAPREVAGRPFRDWVVERAASLGAGIVAEFELPVRASTAPAPWFVLRLEPALPVGAPQPTN
jgi:hypothetical protein